MEAPNRVPPGRFSLQLDGFYELLDCCHGLALILNRKLLVWDPVTGEQHHLATPPGFDPTDALVSASCAVLRSTAGDVQVQHFKVILLWADNLDEDERILARVYSSATGVWGNLISTPHLSDHVILFVPAVLVENSLYWLFGRDSCLKILEFDLERQSLAVVQSPPGLDTLPASGLRLENLSAVMRAEGGGLGFLFLQFWKRKTDRDGVVSWELTRVVELDEILSVDLKKIKPLPVLGYAEENNVLLVPTVSGIFTAQLKSLQFKKFTGISSFFRPFECVYTAGIDGGHGGAELLHNA